MSGTNMSNVEAPGQDALPGMEQYTVPVEKPVRLAEISRESILAVCDELHNDGDFEEACALYERWISGQSNL